jgi:hypothetical protein
MALDFCSWHKQTQPLLRLSRSGFTTFTML